MCRGKPVPVFGDAALSLFVLKFTVELMTPKPGGAESSRGFAGVGLYIRKLPPKRALGSPSWVRLKTLYAWIANCNELCSESFVSFVNARSPCHVCKARMIPFPAFPNRVKFPLASTGGD